MISIKELIKHGWEKTKENMEIVFFTTLFVLVIGSLVEGFGESDRNLSIKLFAMIASIAMIIVRIGYCKIMLKINDGEHPKFLEIFDEYRTFWRYLGTLILYSITILGGLILLIIPGVFWAVRFSFSPMIVVDTKLGPIAAMKESFSISKDNFWKLFWFFVVICLMNFVGLIFFGIGLLITVPVSLLAYIKVYRDLSQKRAGLIQTVSPQAA